MPGYSTSHCNCAKLDVQWNLEIIHLSKNINGFLIDFYIVSDIITHQPPPKMFMNKRNHTQLNCDDKVLHMPFLFTEFNKKKMCTSLYFMQGSFLEQADHNSWNLKVACLLLFHVLRMTSKPNHRLTGSSNWFRLVSIVLKQWQLPRTRQNTRPMGSWVLKLLLNTLLSQYRLDKTSSFEGTVFDNSYLFHLKPFGVTKMTNKDILRHKSKLNSLLNWTPPVRPHWPMMDAMGNVRCTCLKQFMKLAKLLRGKNGKNKMLQSKTGRIFSWILETNKGRFQSLFQCTFKITLFGNYFSIAIYGGNSKRVNWVPFFKGNFENLKGQ